MEESTIVNKKNELIDLVQGIINDYNIMSEVKIQNNCETSLEHRRLNDLIRDQERNTQGQQKVIENLEDQIRKLKKQLHEYEKTIRDLEDNIVSLNEVKEEGNKFSIIKTQSNDILNKDREIERLNKLLVKMKSTKKENKEEKNKIIENVLENVEMNEVSIRIEESEPSPNGSISPLEKEEVVKEEEEEVGNEEIKSIKFTYRKKDYYYIEGEDNNNVYEANGDDIGNKIGNWVMNEKGKRKVVIDK